MAIAFRSVGTRLKVDVTAGGSPQSVSLPAGHVANDFLLMVVATDDNTGPSTPSGWNLLGSASAGTAGGAFAAIHTRLFWRMDNGSLGSSVSVTFNTSSWPTGDPYVLAYVTAWSGCDTASPIETWNVTGTADQAAAQLHPQLTTAVNNDWLVTVRTGSAWAARTVSVSGGSNTERVDDNDGFGELVSALYDSNAALGTGLQTQRTTTTAGGDAICQSGSTMWSLALKPAAVAGTTIATPSAATALGSAFNASVLAQSGPWDLCGAGGLPEYSVMIDWDNLPTPLNDNWTFETDGTGWTAFGGATYARSNEQAYEGVWSGKITTTGAASPRIESDPVAVTPGHRYKASGYIYTDAALAAGASFSVNWYTAGMVYISTSSNIFTPLVSSWLYADGFFVAPATAAFAGVLMDLQGTPSAGIHTWGDLIRIDDDENPDHFATSNPAEETEQDIVSEMTITYGRDQDRQLSPASVGASAFTVVNISRKYSPEYVSSPLHGNLDPARNMKAVVTFGGSTYPLFRGRIDDYNMKADYADRNVDFTFLDGLSDLQGVKLSTGVYQSMRTGQLVDIILDLVGWTGGRDIDNGATIVKYWWVEGTDAFAAIQDLVKSEGPPSIAYVAPDGTFTFRDRHHRLLRTESLNSQGTFVSKALGDCTAPAVTGYSFTPPFVYAHGWRDIINTVSFEVSERVADINTTAVWTSDDSISLAVGQSAEIEITTSDPFVNAITPVQGTDFTKTGAGTVNVVLDRNSGAAAKITFLAVGGSVNLTNFQLRAEAIPVARTVKINRQDTGSVTSHGERTYPDQAPWANANDAEAIANMILLHYAQRRPTVQLRIVTQDPSHFLQVLTRTISDRVTIRNDEIGMNDDFFVERVTHAITRRNQAGLAPVHSVILGCEKQLGTVSNPFTFDKRGAGFNDGVFDPIQADSPDTVFVFDDPDQGKFDVGLFGT